MRYDSLILGAGAAGMMCAAHAGARGGRVLVIDHAKAPGEKIRISGGGRCNFTNLHAGPEKFLSQNPHFAKSALARYTQWDFIALVDQHGIAWHEKTLGQLFCDGKATQIVEMLVAEMRKVGAELRLGTGLGEIAHRDGLFHARLTDGTVVEARTLVVATGGKSIPKMGATGLGYQIAAQFGHPVTDTRPGLVPLTFGDRFAPLAGTALPARVTCGTTSFDEALLFTHRGLSGPAILQTSSYWREGETITLNLLPDQDPFNTLRQRRHTTGRKSLTTHLSDLLPARLATYIAEDWRLTGNLADQSDKALRALADRLTGWALAPTGSEGYRTAEVTLGGVDTNSLDARTMESRTVPGLHFIGEVVDVTGWLGGFNFQWAWSSGHAAGTAIAARNG